MNWNQDKSLKADQNQYWYFYSHTDGNVCRGSVAVPHFYRIASAIFRGETVLAFGY